MESIFHSNYLSWSSLPSVDNSTEVPIGWKPEDYKLYTQLTECLYESRVPRYAFSNDTSYNIASTSMSALRNIMEQFSVESLSRFEMLDLISTSGIDPFHASTMTDLMYDDEAFSYLDKLDLREDGRIYAFSLVDQA